MVNLKDWIKETQVWKSIVRHGYPDTRKNRVLTVLNNFFLHIHPATINKRYIRIRHTWCMGGVTFLLYILLVVTGILLMFYYRPTVEFAFRDIKDLHFSVAYGGFLRNMHRWAGHAMVFTVMAHMAVVFYTGSYKPPREFNWVVGVLLLFSTLFLSFTGYLLPWDQLSYWAVTVGTSMIKAFPILGASGPFSKLGSESDLGFILIGGRTVGQNTLLRFYVLHVAFVPFFITILMVVHFWRVRKDGKLARKL
jgi:quinol-cytochrome oxidoreductase complex cytochrome b subunit